MSHKRLSYLLLSIIAFLTCLCILLLAGCATPQPWTTRNKAMAGAMITGTVLDMASTSYSINHGGVERNPLLDGRPSDGTLAVFGAAAIGAQLLFAHFLPPKWRDWFLGASAALHVGAAGYNYLQYR